MCDRIADAIKSSPAMLKTDAGRFENGWGVDPQTFAPDREKHILVFDLIYCCSTYGLFSDITFKRPKTKEKQLIQEKKEKAVRLSEELKAAREEYECLEEALAYLDTIFSVGTGISHKKYGNGTIIARNGSTVEVEFEDGTKKKLGLTVSAANGIITSHMENYDEMPGSYREVIKKEAAIRNAVSYAEKNFSMYAEYLE